MGAVKGTNVKDLCDLVGGMNAGETLKIAAPDGFSRTLLTRMSMNIHLVKARW